MSKSKARREVWQMPAREWDRGTELVKLFAMTGFLEGVRPASLLLISEPGTGKTELLDRFRINPWLSYQSDLTVKGLYPLLRQVQRGSTTHVVATEFQKYFQRKMSVAENLMGTLVQVMEEGVYQFSGGDGRNGDGARMGLIGAMTNGTLNRKRVWLYEMGFLSRACVFPWDLPPEEEANIMGRISRGDDADVQPIVLPKPDTKIKVQMAEEYSLPIQEFVVKRAKGAVIRTFQRFRTLVMAAALLEGRDKVQTVDLDRFFSFRKYWDRLIED